MSIRQGLLALLAQEPMYGARLRAEFEERTGGTWPLNVGQVYQTLTRLERDGLVEASGQADAEGRIAYRLTAAGRDEVARWWSSPVDRGTTPRDELTIKLALAVTVPGVDVQRVVQTQRTATLRHLQDLTRLKGRADAGVARHELAWQLVLENLVYAAEGEVRWLDHVEASLARAATARGPQGADRTGREGAPDAGSSDDRGGPGAPEATTGQAAEGSGARASGIRTALRRSRR